MEGVLHGFKAGLGFGVHGVGLELAQLGLVGVWSSFRISV